MPPHIATSPTSAPEAGSFPRLAGLAAPGLFVALFAALTILGERLLQDPDTHWHIAVGRRIRETGVVPWVDAFSHTFAGQAWIAKEWLSQIIFSTVADLGGWTGLVLMTAGIIAGAFALLFSRLARVLPATTALIAVLLVTILAMEHFIARPHILTLPLLVIWTLLLTDAADRGMRPSLALVPVMMAWANLHAGYPIAFLIAALIGLEAVARAAPADRVRVLTGWAWVGVLAGSAALVTPYGVEPVRIAVSLFGAGEPLPFITEWQPLQADMIGLLAAGTALGAVLLLAADGRRSLARLALVVILAVLAARYPRFLTLFAVVTVIVCASPLARRLGAAGDAAFKASRAGGAGLVAAGLVAVTLLSTALAPRPSAASTPAAALTAARAAGLTGPVYNSYDFGGFLISQGVPSFIDGRTDQLFLGGFMSGLYRAILTGDAPAFQAIVARHGVTWAIVRQGTPEGPMLASAGWREVHRDAVALVLAKP
jgi:hypothetical protein